MSLKETAEASSFVKELMTEATYYGRNSNLIKVEEQLQIIIDECHRSLSNFSGSKSLAAMERVEDLLAATFGFDDISINRSIIALAIPQALTTTAGCTVCNGAIFKMKTYMTTLGEPVEAVDFGAHKATKMKSGQGWRLSMFIGAGLFQDYGDTALTAREILAVILHEIGHNFYVDPVKEGAEAIIEALLLMTLNEVSAASIVMMYGTREAIMTGSKIIDSFVPKGIQDALRAVYSVIGMGAQYITGFVNPVKTLMLGAMLMVGLVRAVYQRLLDPKRWFGILKYDSEKYSDAFATAYGYGADLVNGLQKLETQSRSIPYTSKEVTEIIAIFQAVIKITMLPFAMLDCHPNTQGRGYNTIQYMKQVEAAKMPPKLRKEYEAELARMEAVRLETKEYSGADAMRYLDKIAATAQDIMQLSDIKDLTSTIGKNGGKYRNLDL